MTTPPPTVLVVEDDPSTLTGYVEILGNAGLRASGVANGVEALIIARRTHPDVIVTDIKMPGLDGLSLAHALLSDPLTRDIPIIGVTGRWTADVGTQAARIGIRTLLLKPCIPDQLLAEIRGALKGNSNGEQPGKRWTGIFGTILSRFNPSRFRGAP